MADSTDRVQNELSGVFTDNDWSNAIKGFNVMSVSGTRNARVIGAPVETGQVAFDNKVIDPLRVTVRGIIETNSLNTQMALLELDEMIENRKFSFYSVCDGENFYNNLILQEFPAIRDVKQVDFIQITLTFVEAMLVQSQAEASSSNSENSNFRKTGTKSI